MTDGNLSLADIASVMNNKDGFLEGNGIVILILFFLIFGMNGTWGGANAYASGALTRSDLAEGFNFQDINTQLRGITSGMAESTYAINNSINNVNSSIQSGVSTLSSQLSNNQYNTQLGFCGVERNIDSVKAEAYKNTCEITNAIHSEGEATRALLTQNTIQDLRDRLAEKDNTLQSAQLTLANASQTQNILNALGSYTPYNSCGCGCNCNG